MKDVTSPISRDTAGTADPAARHEAGAPAAWTWRQAALASAAQVARAGRLDDAAELLAGLPTEVGAAPAVRDLLARIRAQQGRLLDAADCWKRALEMDPGNEASREGLRRIERMQSRPLWVGMVLPVAAAAAAALIVWLVGAASRDEARRSREAFRAEAAELLRVSAREAAAPEASVPAPAAEAPPAAPPAPPREPPPAAGSVLPPLALEIPGVTVRTQQNAVVVQFDEGLFLSAATLKPEAVTLLAALGQRLQPHAARISVQVRGCTDNTPVAEGWIFADNDALGKARALAAADCLRLQGGLPATALTAESGGGEAPYPNDTPQNMLRNRTALIRISAHEDSRGVAP
jgi:type VI secretion system protein ImpK